jgi:hypothetical protein
MINSISPYRADIVFKNAKYTAFLIINEDLNCEDGCYYDINIRSNQKISKQEFGSIKKYLEDEGYIDAAISYFNE